MAHPVRERAPQVQLWRGARGERWRVAPARLTARWAQRGPPLERVLFTYRLWLQEEIIKE
jgi:hypothetical protein